VKILLVPLMSDYIYDLAREMLPAGFELTMCGLDVGEEELAKAIGEADFLTGIIGRPLPQAVLANMGHLKLLQLLSAGYDAIDIEAMRRLRLPVATNGGANAIAVAEHAIMLMLAVYRDLANLNNRVKLGGWQKGRLGAQESHELTGKTVGIVGMGMIGREVAKHLRGFDTTMLYYDVIRADQAVEQALGVQYTPLADLLRAADVVTVHVPLLPSTRGLIGRAELALMKPTALLINTARGGLVDQDALYEALRGGVIAGAGLDTVEPEPPPADLPLFALPNLTVTPHVAGPTVESWPRRLRNGYANIQRVAAGQPPLWVIPEMRDLVQG